MSRKDDMDNHANQMNPNNDAYWESRGCDGRPDDWEDQVADDDERDDRHSDSSSRLARSSSIRPAVGPRSSGWSLDGHLVETNGQAVKA